MFNLFLFKNYSKVVGDKNKIVILIFPSFLSVD